MQYINQLNLSRRFVVRTKLAIVISLTALFLLLAGGSAIAKSFDDVDKSHWAYDAVEYLASKGLVEGYPDGTFKGDKMMSRYELAMLVARAYAKMEDMAAGGNAASIDVEAIMNQLMDEFGPELDEIKGLVEKNSMKIDDLERQLQENSKVDSDLAAKLDKLGSKFKFNGIFKLRWDGTYYNPGEARVQRPRISFRFDMKAPVNDELTFAGRIGTGGEGARIASETTLTGLFGEKAFEIERAYLTWKPAEWPNWTFSCGKFAPMWQTPGNFIDADLNVEGLAAQYKTENWVASLSAMTPADKGGYIVAQIGAEDLITKNLDLYLTYHYLSSGAFETMFGAYPYWYRLDADNYTALEGYAKYKIDWMDWPIYLQAAYRMNLADENTGMPSGLQEAAMAQILIGDIKEVSDYNFYINYGRVLPNSIIPQFAHSTWGVDHQTITVGMGYQLMEHTLLKVEYTNADNLVGNPSGSFDYIVVDVITDF
jgi:hypothetical protein